MLATMKELIEIKDYFEGLAEANPKMAGMVVQLEGAINLNETLHGPFSIYEQTPSSVDLELNRAWSIKLANFFSAHVPLGSFSKLDKLQLAKQFNERFADDLTDETKLIMLLIPISEDWSAYQVSELNIDQSFKSSYNRMIHALRQGASSRIHGRINDNAATVGWFRNFSDTEIARATGRYNSNGVGKATLAFMRIALAPRPALQGASPQ